MTDAKSLLPFIFLTALLTILPCFDAPAAPGRDLAIEEQRVALIIGNSDYQFAPLKNPANDAEAMARALERTGFRVIKRLNATLPEMRSAVREFGDEIKRGGVGLFFFAGHGMQIEGLNYLVPIGADIERKYDVEDQCLRAGYVLGAMEEAGNRLNIIILDACRNNPFRSFRSGGGGLAKMDAPTGSILAYATAPGNTAADGEGDNGLYTSMLLKHINTPGLSIEALFKKVRADVNKASGKAQVPWESTSLTGDFYFIPPHQTGTQKGTKTPEPPSVDLSDLNSGGKSKQQWVDWQAGMERAWDQAESLDNDSSVPAAHKIEAWDRVLTAFEDDNPLTTRDEELKQHAQSRISYWKNAKTAPSSSGLRAIGRLTAFESSHLPPWKDRTYKALNVLDGDPETIWAEGDKKGSGIGQWITLNLPGDRDVAGLEILNGYPRSAAGQDRWIQNGRVKSFLVEFSDGRNFIWNLQDARSWQRVTFPPVRTTYIKLTIREAYRGLKWDDTCVSEIKVLEQ